jgi:hypothetical protein
MSGNKGRTWYKVWLGRHGICKGSANQEDGKGKSIDEREPETGSEV